MLRRSSLKVKLTILVSVVLIVTVSLLTLITFKNVDSRILQPLQKIEWEGPAGPKELKDIAPMVISPAEEIQELNQAFRLSYFYWMIGIAAMGIVTSYYLIQKNLASLTQLKNNIQRVNEHHLANRIDLPNKSDEVGQLGTEYNLMLARLEQSFLYQQRFAENAAHELKTPLTTMKLNLQVLDLETEPTMVDYQEHHEISKESVERLIAIVDQLLLVSSNDQLQHIEEIAVELLISDAIDLLSNDAIEKNIALIHTGESAKVVGNKVLLTQAITNLLSNAIKYTPVSGKVTIQTFKENDFLVVDVKDNGIGIAEANIPYLFEPFYRVDESRTRQLGGSGLGLSLTKRIIEMHHGEISVKSIINEGSTFKMTLPIQFSNLQINKGKPVVVNESDALK